MNNLLSTYNCYCHGNRKLLDQYEQFLLIVECLYNMNNEHLTINELKANILESKSNCDLLDLEIEVYENYISKNFDYKSYQNQNSSIIQEILLEAEKELVKSIDYHYRKLNIQNEYICIIEKHINNLKELKNTYNQLFKYKVKSKQNLTAECCKSRIQVILKDIRSELLSKRIDILNIKNCCTQLKKYIQEKNEKIDNLFLIDLESAKVEKNQLTTSAKELQKQFLNFKQKYFNLSVKLYNIQKLLQKKLHELKHLDAYTNFIIENKNKIDDEKSKMISYLIHLQYVNTDLKVHIKDSTPNIKQYLNAKIQLSKLKPLIKSNSAKYKLRFPTKINI